MESFIDLLELVSTLLWQALAAYVLWKIIPPLKDTIQSRAFSIKFAGLELSAQEATDQIKNQLKDLQEQLIAVQNGLPPAAPKEPEKPATAPVAEPPPGRVAARRVLWVDDTPRNNALQISQLESRGYETILATSTDEALREVERGDIGIIISDMGRTEAGSYVPDAGLRLLKALRETGHRQPFMIYSSARYAARSSDEIKAHGGDGATSSPLEIMGWVNSLDPRGAAPP